MPSRFRTWFTDRAWLVPGWRVALIVVLPLVLCVAGLAGVLLFAGPAAPPPAPAVDPGLDTLPAPGGLLVEVTGAVVHPGLYRVEKGERVSAAIAAAGGFAPDADPDRLPNMAARLRDGEQVKVPSRAGTSRSAASRAAPVDLNAATVDELATVPGFTVELAAAAIRYRTEYGGFTTTRELVDVLQMSESDYILARRYLRV